MSTLYLLSASRLRLKDKINEPIAESVVREKRIAYV